MKIIAAVFLLLGLASCAIPRAPAGPGIIYTEDKELIYFDPYIKPQLKVALCSKNLFGLISAGDASLSAVRMYSPIRKIASIERTYSSRMFFYAQSCLVVMGE